VALNAKADFTFDLLKNGWEKRYLAFSCHCLVWGLRIKEQAVVRYKI